jgi:hypothetical protein
MNTAISLLLSILLVISLGCGSDYTVEEITELAETDVGDPEVVGEPKPDAPVAGPADADAREHAPPQESPAADAQSPAESPAGQPAEGAAPRQINVGPALVMTAPESWQRRQPRIAMIEAEFAAPAAEGDQTDGRMTMMTAGGSVEDNIERWKGQFADAGEAKIEKLNAGGTEVTIVDLAGTYKDQPGPFAPAVERPDYRMLAAIIPTDAGNYFVKFYGPKKTIGDNADGFRAMIESLRAK